jgi:hypothetical protein
MAYNLDEPDAVARFLLGFLTTNHPAMYTSDELARVCFGDVQQGERQAIEEGLAELAGAGLAHRLGEFVFSSHAAMRARELTDG